MESSEQELGRKIKQIKKKGITVFIILHQASALTPKTQKHTRHAPIIVT